MEDYMNIGSAQNIFLWCSKYYIIRTGGTAISNAVRYRYGSGGLYLYGTVPSFIFVRYVTGTVPEPKDLGRDQHVLEYMTSSQI